MIVLKQIIPKGVYKGKSGVETFETVFYAIN